MSYTPGNYVQGSSRTGANPNLTADPTIGQVRLLTDPLAFDVEDNQYQLGIPVLCSLHMNIHIKQYKTLVDNRNFFSYRLPVLEDYSPDGIPTPKEEKGSVLFVKNTPNLDQENLSIRLCSQQQESYVTFGEKDNYSYQVARYRHVVNLMDLSPLTHMRTSPS